MIKLRLLGLLGVLLAARADAIITVNTAISQTEGVRCQAIITKPTGLGNGLTAVAIKEIHSAIFVIDNNFGGDGGPIDALEVKKRMLTASQAWGFGLPFGYESPPTTDPEGPWFGMIWPYRDQYDYFPNQGDPLGDDVGTPVHPSSNVYGFVDVDGIARGGPTDPEPAGGDPNRLLRGITGNGLNGPASYFAFEVTPNFGDPNRFVTLQILSTTARVVVQNQQGAFSEIQVDVAPFQTTIQLPEPTAVGAIMLLALAARARRRRAS